MIHPFVPQKNERNKLVYVCQHCSHRMAHDKARSLECLNSRRYQSEWRVGAYRLLAFARIFSGFQITTMLSKNKSFLVWLLAIEIFVIWSVVLKRLFTLFR